ncbi:unnamed protein product [marine sediment metagenome]|uniref:F420-non-reducing hydrogenase iron-sulfur subunit D domain-containing protein n=1 Tax=marine sediment metagenome TaxID=412755 RepID=X0YFJ9_9ZZZZ
MSEEEGEAKIGVFICHCGTNIGGILDVPRITEYAKTLPNVIYAADNLYTCSEAGLREIRDKIKEFKLSRVVVASCTPHKCRNTTTISIIFNIFHLYQFYTRYQFN